MSLAWVWQQPVLTTVRRMKYMFIIDKLIQQVVLQRDEEDPDPAAAVAELDMRSLLQEVGSRFGEAEEGGGEKGDKGKDEKSKRMGERVRRLEKEVEGLRGESISFDA